MSPADITYVSQDGIRWAMRQSLSHDIRPTLNRHILQLIAGHADQEGIAAPSQARLIKMSGASRRGVERAIRQLKEMKPRVLEVVEARRGRIRFNAYRLLDWARLSQPKVIDEPTQESARKRADEPSPVADRHPHEPPNSTSRTAKIDIDDPTPESDKDSSKTPGGTRCTNQRSGSGSARPVSASAFPSPAAPEPPPPQGVVKRPAGELANVDTELAQMVAIYNEVVADTPLRRSRPPKDLTALRDARSWFDTLGDWRRYCEFAAEDPRCRGERNGRDYPDWRASLDYLLRIDVHDRLRQAFAKRKREEQAQAQAQAQAAEQPEWFVPGAGSLLYQTMLRSEEGLATLQRMEQRLYGRQEPQDGESLSAAPEPPEGLLLPDNDDDFLRNDDVDVAPRPRPARVMVH